MENENQLKNKNVETYTRDMAKAIEGGQGGIIKKIIHEEEKYEAEKIKLSPESKKNELFMIISVVLVAIAVAILAYLWFSSDDKVNTVPVAPVAASIIFTDDTTFKEVDGLNKEKIEELISSETSNTKVKVGGVEGIYLTEGQKVIGLKRFNDLIKGNLTGDQLGLMGDNFLLGAFKSGLSSVSPNIGDPFMLLKVKSFTDIFPVMRAWENKMLYDLGGLFGVTLSPDTNYLFTKSFEDGIVSNKNARILRDNNGGIVLMYVFINDNSIVITNSELATNEVILRINSSQIKK